MAHRVFRTILLGVLLVTLAGTSQAVPFFGPDAPNAGLAQRAPVDGLVVPLFGTAIDLIRPRVAAPVAADAAVLVPLYGALPVAAASVPLASRLSTTDMPDRVSGAAARQGDDWTVSPAGEPTKPADRFRDTHVHSVVVPEPASLGLLALAGVGVLHRRRA